jgi:hypothetical protein
VYYDAILAGNGIYWSQVFGMAHNHPTYSTSTQLGEHLNRYPSGDSSLSDGDRGFSKRHQ